MKEFNWTLILEWQLNSYKFWNDGIEKNWNVFNYKLLDSMTMILVDTRICFHILFDQIFFFYLFINFFSFTKIGICQRWIVSGLGQAFIAKFESPSQGRGCVFSSFLCVGARLWRLLTWKLHNSNVWLTNGVRYDLDGHPKLRNNASLSPWWCKLENQNYPLTGEQLFFFEVVITSLDLNKVQIYELIYEFCM